MSERLRLVVAVRCDGLAEGRSLTKCKDIHPGIIVDMFCSCGVAMLLVWKGEACNVHFCKPL